MPWRYGKKIEEEYTQLNTSVIEEKYDNDWIIQHLSVMEVDNNENDKNNEDKKNEKDKEKKKDKNNKKNEEKEKDIFDDFVDMNMDDFQ